MYNKSYTYRLYPNKQQEVLLQKHFDACRFIYNHFLELKINYYKDKKKTLGCLKLLKELPKLKKEFNWLSEVSAVCLQYSIIHLDNAYTNFFRSNNQFPIFKTKKKSRKSYSIALTGKNITIDYENKKIQLPKFIKENKLKCIFHRKIEGKIKKVTVSQNKIGRYYVSITTEINNNHPTKPILERNKALGIDFGVKTFLTLSNGKKLDSPRYFEQSRFKLAKHKQELDKLTEGTTAHKSKLEQITKLHSKIARQRKDFLDKLTYKMCHEKQVDTYCIEDLSIQKMQQTGWRGMNRCISDLGWSYFVQMLQYKSDWYGKNFIKIGKFDPSSKTCNVCGTIKHDLTLADREWKCSNCNENHDRDVNAAKNVLDFAFTKMKFPKDRNYPIEGFKLV